VALKPPSQIPRDNEVEVDRIFLDIVHMALATDSTRFITLHITGNNVKGIEGVDESYHSLSHHGMDEEKLPSSPSSSRASSTPGAIFAQAQGRQDAR
jgi:hypothetical protein